MVMKKQDYSEALRKVAEKYRNPKGRRFFDNKDCDMCKLVENRCIMCPLNISIKGTVRNVVGCMDNQHKPDLLEEISDHVLSSTGKFAHDESTPSMLKRAEQLELAADFIDKELTDEELTMYNFKRVYPFVS